MVAAGAALPLQKPFAMPKEAVLKEGVNVLLGAGGGGSLMSIIHMQSRRWGVTQGITYE